MRKDLRLGLGIGALALLFAVTFLVVRNHTQSQLQDEGPQQVAVGVGDVPPAANQPVPPASLANPDLPTKILPPLEPMPGNPPALRPEVADPWVKQTLHTPETPMPGGVSANRGSSSNWDILLNQGRRDTASGAALSRAPDPTLTTDPQRSAVPHPTPAPRPDSAGGQLSAMTGKHYTIRSGDTFSSVARQTYGSEKYYLQIEQANPNVNTMRLKPGQQIILPEVSADSRTARTSSPSVDEDNRPIDASREYRVGVGDSLYRIAMKLYGTPRMIDAIYDANRTAIGSDPDRLRLGMVLRLPQDLDGSK